MLFFRTKRQIEWESQLNELEKEVAKMKHEIINLKITNDTLFEAIAKPKASLEKWKEIQELYKNQTQITNARKSN